MKARKNGFTIVELLIVIVVIGVLMAITTVSYNGIQTKAENTKTIQGTRENLRIIELYRIQYGDLPNDSASQYICLGEGYGIEGCVTNTYGTAVGTQSTAFNTELKKIVTALPSMSTKVLTMNNGQKVAGAYYSYDAKAIAYHLSGANQSCVVGGIGGTYGNVTECVITLN